MVVKGNYNSKLRKKLMRGLMREETMEVPENGQIRKRRRMVPY